MDVTVHDLRVVRRGRLVLDVPSLTFGEGSTTAIFGPNGAGKTTLLRAIAGLERPTRGEVRIGGAPGHTARRPIAYAFQSAVFIRGSVRRNLALGLDLQRIPPAQRDLRVAAAARECTITGLLERSAHELSGGEAQRVNLARALALEAPVTLLDEPLAGVDRASRAQLLDELPALLERFATTTILVTHDRDEALRLADHLVVLSEGRVLAAGSKRALHAAPPDADTAALLGYAVLRVGDRELAVPAGGFRLGATVDGAPRVVLRVERVLDTGRQLQVIGTAGGTRIEVPVLPGALPPEPGTEVDVTIHESVPIIFAPSHPEPEQR